MALGTFLEYSQVRIDHAAFLPDGRADIRGRGMQRIVLGKTWIEDGTMGLAYTRINSLTTAATPAATPPRAVVLPRVLATAAPTQLEATHRVAASRCVVM